MKKLHIILLLLIWSKASICQQNKYIIEVNFIHSNGKKAFLTDAMGGPFDRTKAVHVDTAYLINDKCTFKGQFKERGYYSIALDSGTNFFSFIIEPGKIVIKADARGYLWQSMTVRSKQNDWERDAKKTVDAIDATREAVQDSMLKYKQINKNLSLKYSKLIDKGYLDRAKFLLDYVQHYPDCYYAFTQIKNSYYYTPEVFELSKRIFPLFSATIKNSEEGRYLHDHLFKGNNKLLPGRLFPKIISYDVSKKLKEIKLNKNVYLIDFWASWCGPCIAKIPALKNLKNLFKNKGLKIVSISLDNNYKKWITRIKDPKINWDNYCSLNGFKSADAKIFDITAIPYMVLVNKGKIVKLNPSDKEVESYLTKL